MKKSLVLIAALIFSAILIKAQKLPHFKTHTIGAYSGISLIPNAINTGQGEESVQTIIVRSIGLNYTSHISEAWSLGLVYDLQFANFQVQEGQRPINREDVMVLCAIASYEFHHVGISLGPGIEYEKTKSYPVLRLGMEYSLYVANGWWIIPEVSVEYKDVYENYNIGVKLAKSFGKDVRQASHH